MKCKFCGKEMIDVTTLCSSFIIGTIFEDMGSDNRRMYRCSNCVAKYEFGKWNVLSDYDLAMIELNALYPVRT